MESWQLAASLQDSLQALIRPLIKSGGRLQAQIGQTPPGNNFFLLLTFLKEIRRCSPVGSTHFTLPVVFDRGDIVQSFSFFALMAGLENGTVGPGWSGQIIFGLANGNFN